MVDGDGGVLDLSAVEAAPLKVKLPDGRLHDMANPEQLSPRDLSRLSSRWRRARELMESDADGDDDFAEMVSLLVDVANIVLPDAERDVLDKMPWPQLQRLVEAFFDASPAAHGKAEATSTGA